MTDQVQYFRDPWLKSKENLGAVPDDARYLCTYEVSVSVDEVEETAYFVRHEDLDELWTKVDGRDTGRVIHGPTAGTEQEAAEQMLAELIHSRVGFMWPSDFIRAGTIDEKGFQTIQRTVEAELETVKAVALNTQSLIVRTAKALGLGPEPSMNSSTSWTANCPGTSHFIFISTESEEFGCGYCKKRGGPKELEEFVAERKRLMEKRAKR